MRIAAVIIIYHPQETFLENIKTYYNYVDKIFVFNNSETDNKKIDETLQSLSKVEYFQNFKNEGIAKRLNEGANKAATEGFDWILTMDQDSSFSQNSIINYIKCVNEYPAKENVALFGISYSRNRNEVSSVCNSIEVNANELNSMITSGMLVNLELYKKIGDFDENLFIDSVDHDYIINAKLKGFSVVKFPDIFLLHELGKYVYRSSIKSLFIIKMKKEIHSPLRCYYIFRNLLYLQNKYKGEADEFLKVIRRNRIQYLKTCFFYGRNTLRFLKALSEAKHDFNKMKMGKTYRNL